MKYKVKKNKLILEKHRVKFSFNILDVKIHEDLLLVLLDIPNDCKELDNLYAVNRNGTIVWRIQSALKVNSFNMQNNDPYTHLMVYDKIIKVTTFMGLQFEVDSKDGSLINKKVVK